MVLGSSKSLSLKISIRLVFKSFCLFVFCLVFCLLVGLFERLKDEKDFSLLVFLSFSFFVFYSFGSSGEHFFGLKFSTSAKYSSWKFEKMGGGGGSEN